MKTLFPAVALAACLALAGCEQKSKLTDDNVNQIKNGWSITQVENLLGSGTDDTSAGATDISSAGIATQKSAPEKTLVWKDKTHKVIVIFKDGKVVQKSKVPL